MRSFKRWNLEAFSLIEVAIALLIIGIVAWTGQKAFETLIKIKEQKVTNSRLHDVQEAMTAYVARHRRLPCPAALDTHGFPAIDASKCMANPGLIPYVELGLSRHHQVDGCARMMLYGVHPDLAHFGDGGDRRGDNLCEIDHKPGITIRTCGSDFPAHPGSPIAYVLVSYGRKGGSPFDRIGEPTSEEMENDSSDLAFADVESPSFRHHVVYKTADILALQAYGQTCQPKQKAFKPYGKS